MVSDHPDTDLKNKIGPYWVPKKYFGVAFIQKMKAGT
jgi:hypothetical protein